MYIYTFLPLTNKGTTQVYLGGVSERMELSMGISDEIGREIARYAHILLRRHGCAFC